MQSVPTNPLRLAVVIPPLKTLTAASPLAFKVVRPVGRSTLSAARAAVLVAIDGGVKEKGRPSPNDNQPTTTHMTRSNLNYIWQNLGEHPRTLYLYHNGDQYPLGIRDFYRVLDFTEDKPWTPAKFKTWTKRVYEMEPVDLGEGGQPKIFYENGHIVDYTYVFDAGNHGVKVWHWAELVFEGSAEMFKVWLSTRTLDD